MCRDAREAPEQPKGLEENDVNAEHGRVEGLHDRFSLTCVVPVRNEAGHIARFLVALHRCMHDMTPRTEVVVVDDGSTDRSREEVLQVAQTLPIHYIALSRNFGKEFAIQAGLDAAQGDCVIIIDADFQHPLAALPEMVRRWKSGVDMVYAVPANRSHDSRVKRFASRAFYSWLVPRSGVRIPADAGDFRLLDAKVVDALRTLPERNRYMKGLYAWVGFKSEPIEVAIDARASGQSKFGALQLTGLALTGITAFSNAPLRAVSIVGVSVAAFAALLGCWILFEKLVFGQHIPGFATLATSICFLSGVQLLALGIVGEYVGRIFDEVKKRPPYLIADVVTHRSIQSDLRTGAGRPARA